MTKVVINVCHGGFDLSPAAMELYLQRKGIEYIKEHIHGLLEYYYYDPDPDQDRVPHATDLDRHDPVLIGVIEELGLKNSSGPFSALYIEDIEPGTRYMIEEYDGLESIVYPEDVNWKTA